MPAARPAPEAARIPAARRARLLALVRERGAAAVPDLAATLGVSVATVRRDLSALDAVGGLQRARGGALASTAFEPVVQETERHARPAKRAIGALAAALAEPERTLLFDSSSTVLEAARQVAVRGIACTAVTNDLRIASLLAEAPGVRLIVTGGTLRAGSATLMGAPGEDFARDLAVDLAFLGAHAVTGLRVSETSPEVAGMKRAFAAAARRVVLLADSGKFGAAAFVRAFDLPRGAVVVSDDGLPAPAAEALRRGGIELRRAEVAA
jgi:DeoR family transcriptional regulator, aga operon transcriptional repressor